MRCVQLTFLYGWAWFSCQHPFKAFPTTELGERNWAIGTATGSITMTKNVNKTKKKIPSWKAWTKEGNTTVAASLCDRTAGSHVQAAAAGHYRRQRQQPSPNTG
ncbi:hypothetical protein BaRGS_00037104 [Batillaria attramentaria]|uniref:Secreted protein n=1 Tax=Batillaria attramentaria TaxID=370345 RepID=A0ABD0J9J2_9CAEN